MVLEIIKRLIKNPSVTPEDAGCQLYMEQFLMALGFKITTLPFEDVKNFWAVYGDTGPIFAFAGHTDVVPPGPLEKWQSNPFEPTIRDNKLYGRGAADMKGSIAAFMSASAIFLQAKPRLPFRIAFLITSDEEGVATHGTKKVVEQLKKENITIDACIVGEASSENTLGDTIKIGRRGSLSGRLTVIGEQGHIAYPHLAKNPIHEAARFLSPLCQYQWDQGNNYFQPTQFQISNIHAGTGANNVIPAELILDFNFRYSPETSPETLQNITENILNKSKIKYHCQWTHSGNPFFTEPGKFCDIATKAIEKICNITPVQSTSGGTSDGRFLIEITKELIELGPVNASIHQIDEHIDVDALYKLEKIYLNILKQFSI